MSQARFIRRQGSTWLEPVGLAAAELPDIQWAVLENCYTSLEETFDQRCRVNFGLPRWLIAPGVLPAARWLLDLPSGLPSPVEAAKNFRCPVLVLCGEADPFISAAQPRALYDAIPSGKTLHLTPAAGHVDLHRREPEVYEERLRVFLAKHGGDRRGARVEIADQAYVGGGVKSE